MKFEIGALVFFLLILVGCDCQYHLRGVVLDRSTSQPIANVAIGKTDTVDLANPFNRKTLTKENGNYDIYGVAGKCNEVKMFFTKQGYETLALNFLNNTIETIYLDPLKDSNKVSFNLNNPFKIIEIKKHAYQMAEEPDTLGCDDWELQEFEIKKIIQESRPINGPEWHHLFDHLPCTIEGLLIQDSVQFEFSFNGGSWFTITSADTSITYGSFDEENRKFFLSDVWIEN